VPPDRQIGFCLTIAHGEWSSGNPATAVERTVGYARLADEAGFDSVWLNEDPDGWDAFAVLGALSRETSSIRLGTGVTNFYNRSPNLVAASVATLDRLSNGRSFLGVGRSQPEVYQKVFQLDTSEPLALMEQSITLLREWWAPGYAAVGPGLGGRWQRSFGPESQPPIYVAAVGPRALELAGRCADGVLFNELATPHFVEWAVKVAIDAATRANRDPAALRFFVNPAVTVTDDPQRVLDRKKSFMIMVHALPGMDRLLMSNEWDVPGIFEEVRAAMRIEEVLERGGLFADLRQSGDLEKAKRAIPSGLIDAAAAIGSLDHVRGRLAEYASKGATDIFIDRRGLPDDPDEVRELLSDITRP
jgi:alkanesulfonate monooxygenase SsuD/methylene tetrahydromethanopterin reductase-like flavin-dependent oxidoreductase (luciferase family)